MEHLKRWLIVSLILLLCMAVLLVVCLFKISALSSLVSLSAEETECHEACVESLRSELNGMKLALEELARRDASLLSVMDYSMGEPAGDTNMVPVRLSIVPKILTEDMRLSVTIGDVTTPLTREGNTFLGDVEVGLFYNYNTTPLLTIESAAGIQTEYLEDMDFCYLFRNYLPELCQYGYGTSSGDSEDMLVDATFGFETKTEYLDTPVTFTDVTMVKEVNAKEVLRQDILSQITESDEVGPAQFSTQFQMKPGEETVIRIIAQDSLGYVHTLDMCCRFDGEADEGVQIEWSGSQIHDRNGELVFETPW